MYVYTNERTDERTNERTNDTRAIYIQLGKEGEGEESLSAGRWGGGAYGVERVIPR